MIKGTLEVDFNSENTLLFVADNEYRAIFEMVEAEALTFLH